MVGGAFVVGVCVFGLFSVAGGRNCSCTSNEGVFGVKICPTARESRCKGFEDAVKICCEVSTNRAGVADIG